jgi:hypothetical protein
MLLSSKSSAAVQQSTVKKQRSMMVLRMNECRQWIVPVVVVYKSSQLQVSGCFSRWSVLRRCYSMHQRHPSQLSTQRALLSSSHHLHSGFHRHHHHCHRWLPFRMYASSSDESGRSNSSDSALLHQFYLQQIQEMELERESLFGAQSKTGNVGKDSTMKLVNTEKESSHHITAPAAEAMKLDREALFGFTSEERLAWSQVGGQPSSGDQSHADLLRDIEMARRQPPSTPPQSTPASASFTHLSSDGANIQMVDVGAKAVTRRTATAQSVVLFPQEVLLAFGSPEPDGNATARKEWMGKKGPIFATAITAGIMGVKQTSVSSVAIGKYIHRHCLVNQGFRTDHLYVFGDPQNGRRNGSAYGVLHCSPHNL